MRFDHSSYRFRDGYVRKVKPSPAQPIMPLTLLKTHCRIPLDLDVDDALLAQYQSAAEKIVEAQCEIALRNQEWEYWANMLPPTNHSGLIQLRLEVPPVTAVTWIKYYDSDGVQRTFSPDNYNVLLDSNPPLITIKPRSLGFSVDGTRLDQWRIHFVCGLPYDPDDEDAPTQIEDENAIQAIAFLVAHWYRNREPIGGVAKAIPLAFDTCRDACSWRCYP